MTQLVSHSSCSLAFIFIYITLATQEELAVAHLVSPLAYFFISSEYSKPPSFSPLSIVHFTVLCLTRPCTCTVLDDDFVQDFVNPEV